MKHLALFGVIFSSLLGGCSTEQEPPQTPEAVESEAAATAEPAIPTMDEAIGPDDGNSQIVEESAAAEEALDTSEKPLMLAQADTGATSGDWKFVDGTHFTRLVPTQPTIGGADKIEVAEVFWYGCAHCFDFEPYINKWAKDLPSNVSFVRIPALWNDVVKLHGRLYFTEEVLNKNGKIADPDGFRTAVFLEYHRRGNRLTSESSIQAVFTRFGVSDEDFKSTWGSFEVAQKLRVAEDLARRWNISSVPAVVVNGKYLTGGAQAGSYPKLLEVINELVARETVR